MNDLTNSDLEFIDQIVGEVGAIESEVELALADERTHAEVAGVLDHLRLGRDDRPRPG